MSKYTKENLQKAVSQSKSYADVCRIFKVKDSTGAQTYITNKIREFKIDTSHFIGMAWRKGRQFNLEWVKVDKYLTKNSKIGSHALKKKLFRENLKEQKCESCGLDTWLGEPIVLELDHKDSNHSNNELGNLQILCSNCHATFTRQRIKQKRGSGEMVNTR